MKVLPSRASHRRPRRLINRFRRAGMWLLLPLLGSAAVSGAALVVNAGSSSALQRAQIEQDQLDSLYRHVQDAALAGAAALTDHAADDFAALTQEEADVEAALVALGQGSRLTPENTTALSAAAMAWRQSAAARQAIRSGSAAPAAGSVQAGALEDELARRLADVAVRVDTMQQNTTAQLAGLERDVSATQRTSAIAVVVDLVLGLAACFWFSRRLALSVLTPLARLRDASDRLAGGDLSQRVEIDTSDEIADLAAAFNSMADQLTDRQEAMEGRERRFIALIEDVNDDILVIAEDGRFLFATPSFDAAFKNPGTVASTITDIVHPDDQSRAGEAWARTAAPGGPPSEVEVRLRRTDGQWRHVLSKLTNRLSDPAVAGVVVVISDVSERHEHQQRLLHQALHDAVTGLANRELFGQRLEQAVEADVSGHRPQSVLHLEFDDLKSINDTAGYDCGDVFLRTMSTRLLATARPEDIVARLGGGEFAVLLVDTPGCEATVATERMLAVIAEPYTAGGRTMVPTVSVGIACSDGGAARPETLLADAGLAMYFARQGGPGRYKVFQDTMRIDLMDRLQLGEDLSVAIAAGRLSVHYQPIVDLRTGTIVGAEALARWKHPTRGWVGPFTFIPLAEEIGLVDRIDAWVLAQACRQGRAWTDAGLPSLRMAVNLSGRDLDRADLVPMIAATLAETRFPAACLELELTEGVAVADSPEVRATLAELKALGVHLAIDDFGTGYSALSRLRSLPFDSLKIDKSFVDELADGGARPNLVESILDMAHVLGLRVVAEGVETAGQADFLRERHCELAQGYVFSRPVDATAFRVLLAARRSLTPHPPAVTAVA